MHIGYAGHIGEACRPFIAPTAVNVGYALAATYALADGIDKISSLATAGDVFLWQLLATFVLPGAVCNRVSWATAYLMRGSSLKGSPRLYAPTAAALLVMPLIVWPIDNLVDSVLDQTYRKMT